MNKDKYTYQDGVNSFLTVLVADIVFLIVYSVICTTIASSLGITIIELFDTSQWIFYLNLVLSQVVFFSVFIVYNLIKHKNYMRACKITKPNDGKIVLLVVALSVVCLFGFNYFIGLVDYSLGLLGFEPGLSISITTFPKFLIYTVLLALLPAVFEELIFRGMIFNGLSQKLKPKTAIILSAIIFALIHMNIYQTVYQLVLGILLASIVYLTGSLAYSIIFHFINNFLALLIGYISDIAGVEILSFNTWGWFEIVSAIVIMIASVLLLVLLLKALKKHSAQKAQQQQLVKEVLDTPKTNIKAEKELSSFNDLSKKELDNLSYSSFILSTNTWLGVGLAIAGVMWIICLFG